MNTIFTALVVAVAVLAIGSGIASATEIQAAAGTLIEGCGYGYGH